MTRTLWDKTVKDSHGRIILWQKPNLPLTVWFLAYLTNKIINTGDAATAIGLLSFGALFTWAWLELFQGVNYLRKGLGLVVIIFIVAERVI